jgi:hypothetical protein
MNIEIKGRYNIPINTPVKIPNTHLTALCIVPPSEGLP